MAELLPCPFCGGEADTYEYEAERNIYDSGTLGYVDTEYYTKYGVGCTECGCIVAEQTSIEKAITAWNTRTPKERGEDKPKITCLNCKHLMFSDMYGECNKQLRIVNPSDTCEYAEPKERGGEK